MPPPPPAPSGPFPSRWDPQVLGLVGLICSVFLLFSYYKILERNCYTFRVINLSRNQNQRRRLNEHLEEFSSQFQSGGLNPRIMQALPITRVEEKVKNEQSSPHSTECAVCLGEFEEGEWVKTLPSCSHAFHVACIDMWFQTHSSCPLCRSYVCDASVAAGSYPTDVNAFLETLDREDFHRGRSERYTVVGSQLARSGSDRTV